MSETGKRPISVAANGRTITVYPTPMAGEVVRILRCFITSAENDWQRGTFECGFDSSEAAEMMARFHDQQPIMLNGHTFRVTGYETVAYQGSGAALLVNGHHVASGMWTVLQQGGVR